MCTLSQHFGDLWQMYVGLMMIIHTIHETSVHPHHVHPYTLTSITASIGEFQGSGLSAIPKNHDARIVQYGGRSGHVRFGNVIHAVSVSPILSLRACSAARRGCLTAHSSSSIPIPTDWKDLAQRTQRWVAALWFVFIMLPPGELPVLYVPLVGVGDLSRELGLQ